MSRSSPRPLELTTETNPNQEPKKQVAGVGLSEEDVIALIKRYTENTVDSYPVAYGILEIDNDEHPLTPEIEAFIDKCFKVGKISALGYLCNLNFAYINVGYLAYCYGCTTSYPDSTHENNGIHIEITVDKTQNTYACYYHEL